MFQAPDKLHAGVKVISRLNQSLFILSKVARLHTWGLQERVIARDSRGRQISIPKNYEIEFEVIDRKKNKKGKSIYHLSLITEIVFLFSEC